VHAKHDTESSVIRQFLDFTVSSTGASSPALACIVSGVMLPLKRCCYLCCFCRSFQKRSQYYLDRRVTFQLVVYVCTMLLVINQHFEIQTMIFAGSADIGQRDRIITSPDDFFCGTFYCPLIRTDYFINPPAGIFDNGLTAVLV